MFPSYITQTLTITYHSLTLNTQEFINGNCSLVSRTHGKINLPHVHLKKIKFNDFLLFSRANKEGEKFLFHHVISCLTG